MKYKLKQESFMASAYDPTVNLTMEYYSENNPDTILFVRGFGLSIRGLVTQSKITEAAKIEAEKINQQLIDDGTLAAIELGSSLTFPEVIYDSGRE